jgi:hypothetical protein
LSLLVVVVELQQVVAVAVVEFYKVQDIRFQLALHTQLVSVAVVVLILTASILGFIIQAHLSGLPVVVVVVLVYRYLLNL